MQKVINLALVAIVSMTMMSCMSVHIGDVDKTPTQVQQIDQVTAMQPFDEVEIAGAF